MRTCFSVHERQEILLGAASRIILGRGGAPGEELDGGIGFDALLLSGSLCIFGFGVNLGDEDFGLGDVVLGYRLPNWSQALAVYSKSC